MRAFERSRIIGQRGALYSVLGVAVLEPTVEYPNLAISISLSNGKSYAFSQIKMEEFNNLVQALQEWRDLIVGILPELEQKSRTYNELRQVQDAQIIEAQQKLAEAQRMVDLMGGPQ